MSLIQRIPWTVQPQSAVSLSPAFARNGYAAAAPGQSVVRQPTTPVVVGTIGRMWRANGAEQSTITGVDLFPNGTPYTIIASVLANTSTGLQTIVAADDITRVLQLRLSNSAVEFVSFHSGAVADIATISGTAFSAGVPFAVVATATDSKISVFCNGKTVTVARASTNVSSNAGNKFEIGGKANAAYLTGGVYGVVVAQGSMSDAQALDISRSAQAYFSSVFAPQPRRIWAPSAAVGGNAAVTLGSAAGTSSAGTVTVSAGASVAVTSAAATSAAGTVAAAGSAITALSGAAATSSAGTLTVSTGAVVALSGAAATASAGTATVSAGASVAIASAAAAAAVGTVTATAGSSATATITGAAVASAAGMITVTAGASTTLASAAATGRAGNVSATNGAAVASSIRFDLSTGRIIKIINRSVTISF